MDGHEKIVLVEREYKPADKVLDLVRVGVVRSSSCAWSVFFELFTGESRPPYVVRLRSNNLTREQAETEAHKLADALLSLSDVSIANHERTRST